MSYWLHGRCLQGAEREENRGDRFLALGHSTDSACFVTTEWCISRCTALSGRKGCGTEASIEKFKLVTGERFFGRWQFHGPRQVTWPISATAKQALS